MNRTYNIEIPKRILIDIPATSRRLKYLRESRGFTVKQLQEMFGFEYPVAIYEWENESSKKLPCLENLHRLSKLYGLHVEELYVAVEIDDAPVVCDSGSEFSLEWSYGLLA